MPSASYSPYARVNYYRRTPGGASLVGPYQLTALYQANASNTTTNGVNQSQIQIFDPDHAIVRKLNPNPMDVITIEANGVYTPRTLTPIWTGIIDIATNHMDLQTGNVLVLNCSSPYKLWENTTLNLGSGKGGASGSINDPFQLALASIRGITANDVVSATAKAVGYTDGFLHSLPWSPQTYIASNAASAGNAGTAIGGLWNLNIPDNMASLPELQTYSAVIQGMLADTATELFFDEQGNLIFREIGYLNTNALPTQPSQPLFPRRVLAQDIISSDLGLSDQGVITEVRVRWNYDAVYTQDGFWIAPQGVINQLGARVRVINAPWLMNQQAAMFMAQAVGQMAASGVAIGSITMPLDPGYKVGTLVQVQDPSVPPGNYSYYYIVGIVYSMVWGQPWTMTLQLGYGRSPTQSFPYIGTESIPIISNFKGNAISGPASGGVPGGGPEATQNTLSFNNGQLSVGVSTTFDGSLGSDQISADTSIFPIGTKVILKNTDGQFIGPSISGTYTVTSGSPGQQFVGINAPNVGVAEVIPIAAAPAKSTATTGSVNPAPGSGTPTVTPSTGGTISGVYPPPPGTSLTNPGATPSGFPYWPVSPSFTITQPFGPTSYTGEPAYTDSKGQSAPHYHLGIDIGAPMDTPIMCPVGGGTVLFAGWDSTGYGNCTTIQVGKLIMLFGHQDRQMVVPGDQPVHDTVIGLSGTTGNSSGPHLHFGVYDTSIGFWVDPMQYLTNAIP